jgi:hypothetical protein
VSERQGHLGNPRAQDLLREQDRDFLALEDADVEWLLQHEEGRRIAMRLVYVLLRLDSPSFEPGIKDGIAAALHTARNEGMREAGTVFGGQLRRVSRELWLLAHEEKWAAEDREGQRRAEAKRIPSDGE